MGVRRVAQRQPLGMRRVVRMTWWWGTNMMTPPAFYDPDEFDSEGQHKRDDPSGPAFDGSDSDDDGDPEHASVLEEWLDEPEEPEDPLTLGTATGSNER